MDEKELLENENDSQAYKKRKHNTLANYTISGASSEVVSRYGSAVKEDLVAYGGVDNEHGVTLTKGLKSISKSKINPNYKNQNTKQQAGFSAEVVSVSRTNKKNTIEGRSVRKIRTDDIGSVNDPLKDHVTLDKSGNVIAGSGTQMKFVGKNGSEWLDYAMSDECKKYRDNDVPLECPSDYYDEAQKKASEQIEKLQKEVGTLKGKADKASVLAKKEAEIEKLQKIKKNLRKSKVSSKEAIDTRLYPEKSTVEDVAKLGGRAALQGLAMGAAISGGFSIVQNAIALAKGEKDLGEATIDTIVTTGKGAIAGGASAGAGALIKGVMQNSGKAFARTLSKTALPAYIVSATVETTKTLCRYFNGDIDDKECLIELGEKGTGMISSAVYSAVFASVGQLMIPIPALGAFIGGLVGGFVGSALNSAFYKALTDSFKEADLAHKRRLEVERYCKEAIERANEFRAQVERVTNKYIGTNIKVFNDAFSLMDEAIRADNIDDFIAANCSIQKQLGYKSQFSNFSEFNTLMLIDRSLEL